MVKIDKDDAVLKLLEKIKMKKLNIEKVSNPIWKTNCTLDINGKVINVKTINTIEKLVEVLGWLTNDWYGKLEATKSLRLENSVSYIGTQGFSNNDWENDFINVKNIINVRQLKEELANDEKVLDRLLSKDKKDELELKALLSKYEK